MNPLSTAHNNYYKNEKNSTIYTPDCVVEFLYTICSPFLDELKQGYIFDPAVGSGNLLKYAPETFKKAGVDLDNQLKTDVDFFLHKSFFECEKEDFPFLEEVKLVILNPPFNTDKRNRAWLKENKLGKGLLPEIFSDKVFSLFGKNIPFILFTPMGLLKNQRVKSNRWKKMRDFWPQICSIVSLPLNIFPNVEFHNEILIFNIPYLKPHYFLDI